MLNLGNRFWDLFPHILVSIYILAIIKVNQDMGRHMTTCSDGLGMDKAAFVNTSKTLCSTFMEMSAELGSGETHASFAAMQKLCSETFDNGVKGGSDCTWDKGLWTLLEHPWLLLTNFICFALIGQVITSRTMKRCALRVGRDEKWTLINLANTVNFGRGYSLRTTR